MSSQAIHVVAAVLYDARGRILISQRLAGTHMAGRWEFPGGKLEPGENPRAGLARELREELGIVIGAVEPLIRLRHRYPEREVLLDVWRICEYRGEPTGLEGQPLRWVSPRGLRDTDLLEADLPIVDLLSPA